MSASYSLKRNIEELGRDIAEWKSKLGDSSKVPEVKKDVELWASKWNAEIAEPMKQLLLILRKSSD